MSPSQEHSPAPSVEETDPLEALRRHSSARRHPDNDHEATDLSREQSPPPQYPASEASSSSPLPRPPPFSSLFSATAAAFLAPSVAKASATNPSPYSFTPCEGEGSSAAAPAYEVARAETKHALPSDTKEGSSRSAKDDDAEPPPAYSEGDSPLESFTYLMAAAGGASSIITQVQQGGPPINTIGDVGADETIAMDLRGTRFVLNRDELLTLPEFVLLSLFPNGLFPEGHMGDAVQVDVSLL